MAIRPTVVATGHAGNSFLLSNISLPLVTKRLLISVFTIATNQTNQDKNNTYAIQNVRTGTNLRPYKAGIENGNRIILYKHVKWKCMTWQFIQVDQESYQLKNEYTSITFQPSSKPESGVTLTQQALKTDNLQYWEFIKQSDETYMIRLKGTSLYITISANKSNSSIILMPVQNSSSQKWRLIKQNPLI